MSENRSAIAPFVTDLGAPQPIADAAGHIVGQLPRFGVWVWDPSKGGHQCFDTGDDLPALLARYQIPRDRVQRIPSGPGLSYDA